MSQTKPPAWVWGLLVAAVFGVSSAGTLLQQIDLDPLLKASWRLQLTSVVLFPFAIWQWRQQPEAVKQQMFERRTLGILALSGLALALHFGSWVASLKYTTLTHSLLFVTAHPLIVVAGMFLLGFMAIGVRKPTRRELAGALIGFCGAALTLFDEGDNTGGPDGDDFGGFARFAGRADGGWLHCLWTYSSYMDAHFPLCVPCDAVRGSAFASRFVLGGRTILPFMVSLVGFNLSFSIGSLPWL